MRYFYALPYSCFPNGSVLTVRDSGTVSEVCPPAFRGDGKLAGRYVPLVLAQNFSHAPAPSARVRPCIFSTAKLAGARSRNRDYLEPAPAILKFAFFLPFFFWTSRRPLVLSATRCPSIPSRGCQTWKSPKRLRPKPTFSCRESTPMSLRTQTPSPNGY